MPVLTGSAAYALGGLWLGAWPGPPSRQGKGVLRRHRHRDGVGLLINFVGINPIGALFFTAVINGMLAPPVLLLLMLVSNKRSVMKTRTNGIWLNIAGWFTTLAMTAAAIALIATA